MIYSTVTENSSSSVQIGQTNTTKIKVDPKRQTDAPFFIEQYGETNYFIIQLDDRRQSRHLELRSSEDGKGVSSCKNLNQILSATSIFCELPDVNSRTCQ